jgi:hypothetical protein
MYRSTDAQGKAVAVTGTYIEPDVPWPGNGPRPLLAYATGPYGAGASSARRHGCSTRAFISPRALT